MAKKKMSKAQAAAARRPDDWEAPQQSPKKKAKPSRLDNPDFHNPSNGKESFGITVPFIIAIIALAIIVPIFLVFVWGGPGAVGA